MRLAEEEKVEESVPLSRFGTRDSSVSASSVDNNGTAAATAAGDPFAELHRLPAQMAFQAIAAVAFGYTGWYGPRVLAKLYHQSIIQRAAPFQVTRAGDVILDSLHTQALVDPPTIPSSILMWTSIWIPLLIVSATSWFGKHSSQTRRWYDLHSAACGFISAVGLSEGCTQLLKLYMQRRRPNFYALCGFDSVQKICTAAPKQIVEANFSFPSGHSSLSCCAMTFLVWFFLGKIMGKAGLTTDAKRILGFVACTPWGWSIFVAASRVADQWHHPSDIVAGLVLGGFLSTVMYHFWYPPVWTTSAGIPWSFSNRPSISGKLPSFHE
eukprot:CAMPEP_0198146126 /NCGR_PEP_ID=MMETSP1443-20131203/27561_1 /TAXON_ID=186043 /ORGANISM="Entomoneis sp., Strain CCMP2396" /LENGTH=324 /DNA_ID=CAMNT_0043809971 /DNA_START=67 /DNA_END=1041 /DNA_ORIENTATION=+